jgi:outer membrane lipoprotein-sorting protein
MKTALWLLLLALTLPVPAPAAEPSAKEIMTRNEEARKIHDVQSEATITTGGGGSGEKIKQFTWWRNLTADGLRFNTLTRFHAPAEVRGEGILFLEHEGDQNDVQIYLPAYKKIRRVESQAQSGSFMGSEFSYADIATPHVNDYKHSLLSRAECVTDTGPASCYVVESLPATDAVKERTGYSKTVQWIRPDNFMAVRGEFYDPQGALFKKMTATDIREVDSTQHKWMAESLRLENAKSGRFTSLKFTAVKVNAGIPESTFSMQNLAREK